MANLPIEVYADLIYPGNTNAEFVTQCLRDILSGLQLEADRIKEGGLDLPTKTCRPTSVITTDGPDRSSIQLVLGNQVFQIAVEILDRG